MAGTSVRFSSLFFSVSTLSRVQGKVLFPWTAAWAFWTACVMWRPPGGNVSKVTWRTVMVIGSWKGRIVLSQLGNSRLEVAGIHTTHWCSSPVSCSTKSGWFRFILPFNFRAAAILSALSYILRAIGACCMIPFKIPLTCKAVDCNGPVIGWTMGNLQSRHESWRSETIVL